MKLVKIDRDAEIRQIAGDIEAIRDLGFEHVAYAGLNPLAQTIHGHVTYGPEWSRFYAENQLHAQDPILLRAARSVAPVDWHRLGHSDVFERARDFGLPPNGLTVPVRGPFGDVGLLSVSGWERGWDKLIQDRIGALQTLAVTIHDQVISGHPATRSLMRPSLSTREREILQWAAAGRTQADISSILAISARTVEVHFASARAKLGAMSTSQAVGRAIAMGLIFAE